MSANYQNPDPDKILSVIRGHQQIVPSGGPWTMVDAAKYLATAPSDIAWLLHEVERLHGASVSERSQDTSLSVGKPLRTENGTELLPAWKAAAKKWRKRALMYERVKS